MDKDCDCVICKYYRGEVSKDFMLGYFEGKKEDAWIKLELAEDRQKWHDLRKDPNDLPSENCECWCYVEYFGKQHRKVWYNGEWEAGIKIIAWCELPKFEE